MKTIHREKRRTNCTGELTTIVMGCIPNQDAEGRYVPFCDFHKHQGIPRKPEVCEQRQCHHYKKLYINGNGNDHNTGSEV